MNKDTEGEAEASTDTHFEVENVRCTRVINEARFGR